jgi:hypothetical protein
MIYLTLQLYLYRQDVNTRQADLKMSSFKKPQSGNTTSFQPNITAEPTQLRVVPIPIPIAKQISPKKLFQSQIIIRRSSPAPSSKFRLVICDPPFTNTSDLPIGGPDSQIGHYD